ncbi:MAG: adenylyltransferase [Actinomycetota bacterium]|jgi:ATP adenylyltransferase|nr:adenylyltransferase [Actinomycetota bacterium]
MLDRLWAGWRSQYIASSGADSGDDGCVLCRVLAHPDEREALVVWRGEHAAVILNAYPYTSGHVMVLPLRHVGDLEDLDGAEASELWAGAADAVRAIKQAYEPGGLNLGANLGRAAGAGVPGHLHVHVLPRWSGDTNFMTSVAEARVLPEPLSESYDKVKAAWPVS